MYLFNLYTRKELDVEGEKWGRELFEKWVKMCNHVFYYDGILE